MAVAGRGSALFAGSVSTRLSRAMLEETVVEGFFPLSDSTQMPVERSRGGLSEFGLDYAADAAISRHIARFLSQSRRSVLSSEALTSNRHYCFRSKHIFCLDPFKQ